MCRLPQVAAYAASIPPLVRGGGCGVSPAPKDDSGLYMLKVRAIAAAHTTLKFLITKIDLTLSFCCCFSR